MKIKEIYTTVEIVFFIIYFRPIPGLKYTILIILVWNSTRNVYKTKQN